MIAYLILAFAFTSFFNGQAINLTTESIANSSTPGIRKSYNMFSRIGYVVVIYQYKI